MKREIQAIFLALALFSGAACSSSGGGTTTYLALNLPLNLSADLNAIADALGGGDFGTPIKFNMESTSGALDMVDGFFTFLNNANIPDGSEQVSVVTDQGVLKADFLSLMTVEGDFNMDGTVEVVDCSRSTTLPICARFWIDDTPLAFLVLVESSSDTEVGEGMLRFVPSLVGLAASTTDVSAYWHSGTADDEVRAFYLGEPSSGVNATKAALTLTRDRSQATARFLMKQSGEWSSNPISGCSESQAIFGWVDSSEYISARFANTANCTLPAGGPCVTITTAAEAAVANCAVNVDAEQYIGLTGFEAANAQLPDDFPPTPPF